MPEMHNNVRAVRTIAPISLGATAAGGKVGKVVDRNGYGTVEFLLEYGTVTATNANIVPVIKEGDVTGTMTSVADADLIGTETAAALGQAATRTSDVSKNVVRRIGYKGAKRYVSCNLVPSVSGAMVASATVLLGRPRKQPTAA